MFICAFKKIQQEIKDSFIVAINELPIYGKSDALVVFTNLHDDNTKYFTVTLAPLPKSSTSDIDQSLIKIDLSAPLSIIETLEFHEYQEHIVSVNFDDLCNITTLQHPELSHKYIHDIPMNISL